MKRLTALMLALCMLIGLPMAVGAADEDAPLSIAWAELYATNEPHKFAIRFSEKISSVLSSGLEAYIGIYQGTENGLYRYKWDTANNTCSEIALSGSASDGWSTTRWQLGNPRHPEGGPKLDGEFYCKEGQYGFMADIANKDTLAKIEAIYRKILAQDSNVRLVVSIIDGANGTPDGYIDLLKSADGTKKLKATTTVKGVDWAEFRIFQEILGADLQEDTLLMHFANPVNLRMNATYQLGLYDADGVQNEEAGTWDVTADQLRYYGEDQKTLVTNFARYDAVMTALAASPDHELGLTVVSKTAGVDGFVSDETDSTGRKMLANTTVGGVDAVYTAVSTDKETLRLVDVKFFNSNKLLVTFNKPISFTTNHWSGLTLYSGTSIVRFREVETGYEMALGVTVGTDGWKLANWMTDATFEPYGIDGTQYLVDLKGKAVAEFQEIIKGSNYDLRFRIQENANQGANNGVVDTIWATGDTDDRLRSSVYNANQDQAWCSVSGWEHKVAAVIGAVEYHSLDAALNVAVPGDTVVLNESAHAEMVTLPAGVTLDLNGNSLITDYFFGFGYVIDSAEGVGALVVSRNRDEACIYLQTDNPTFPLYDASAEGYRFFTYSLSSAGTKADTENADHVKYGIKLKFDSLLAYELLADQENADVALTMDLTIDNRTFVYKFTHNIFNALYQTVKSNHFANRGNYAITLTVRGLDCLSDDDAIVATPILYSAQKVRSNGKTMVYEGAYDSYTRAKVWIRERIDNNRLFSFTYNGVAYANHMNENNWTKSEAKTDTGWRVSYTHKKDNVVAWSEITFDPETASVEWTNYFRNEGNSKSPIISDIRAIDSTVTVENPTLTSANGSTSEATDFRPYSIDLTTTTEYVGKMKTSGGLSSQGNLPYFDISNGEYGIMGGIGWTGNWSADFVNDNGNITIDAGMQKTNIALTAGEQMRTPMIMIQFFKGDQDAGHNAFRRLILKSYTPSDASGKPIEHAIFSASVGNAAGQGEEAILNIAKQLESSGSQYECLWIDAGWQGDVKGDNLSNNTWQRQVGNWYFIEGAYTDSNENGTRDIRTLRQRLTAQGKDLLLWIEPERVRRDLAKTDQSLYNMYSDEGYFLEKKDSDNLLWDFSKDDACNEMIDIMSAIIKENGVTWYRQDFNTEPQPYWELKDKFGDSSLHWEILAKKDRVGMTEIKYITNLYRYLDELVKRNPGLMIDNCAAGGRRLDLEMMKRSVPLWNSDYGNLEESTLDEVRTINYNLSWWLPIHGGKYKMSGNNTRYIFRAAMNSGMSMNANTVNSVSNLIPQYSECRELMNGDYYILAGGKAADCETTDACYEFYKSEAGKGYLVAFRLKNCTTESATYYLKGLDERAMYALKWEDTGTVVTATGAQLMQEGLTVTYPSSNLSHLIYITKQ